MSLNSTRITQNVHEHNRAVILPAKVRRLRHKSHGKRYTRLKFAHLSGCPQGLGSCNDFMERNYAPEGVIKTLSSENYIRNDMNVCILGASDRGKTYLAKAFGIAARVDFSVAYYCTKEPIELLSDIKEQDLAKYNKRRKHLCKHGLLILDDFLLH